MAKSMSAPMTIVILLSTLTGTLITAFPTNPLCAAVCVCEHLEENEDSLTMDCSRVYLSIVPPVSDWPINITHIDLSFNNITSIGYEMSHDTIEVLNLAHNRIGTLAQNAFGGLLKLKYLNLANNVIRNFDEDGFYGLEHLKSLNLSSNGLKLLPDKLFYKFIGLQELSLADNPLVHIDPIHFNRMISLRWLDLSSTNVYTLPANIFHITGQLQFLDLTANEFHDVPTDSLRSAVSLKHLRLSENPIDYLDRKSFTKLSNLEILELNSMYHLKEVREKTFSDLKSLRVLDLKFNRQLSSIHHLAFDGLFNGSRPNLQELDLEGNNLHAMDKDMVACAKMRKFNVQKNPWICDCNLRWFKYCEMQKVYTADLRCYSPVRVMNAMVSNMNEEDFQCLEFAETQLAMEIQHHETVVKSVSVGLAAGLLVIIAFGMAVIFKWKSIKTWYKRSRKGTGAVYYVRARANPGHM